MPSALLWPVEANWGSTACCYMRVQAVVWLLLLLHPAACCCWLHQRTRSCSQHRHTLMLSQMRMRGSWQLSSLRPWCAAPTSHWLSASVLADDASKRLLGALQPQLKRLLLLKQARSPSAALGVDDIKRHVPQVPPSWLLPARDIKPARSRKVEWQLDVAAIKQAAQDSAKRQASSTLASPSILVGGVRWRMELACRWEASKQCSRVDVDVMAAPPGIPPGAVCRCTYSVDCDVAKGFALDTDCFTTTTRWGRDDFFKVGPMPAGFDEAAWAAKGLPKAGSIMLKLSVQDVGV